MVRIGGTKIKVTAGEHKGKTFDIYRNYFPLYYVVIGEHYSVIRINIEDCERVN